MESLLLSLLISGITIAAVYFYIKRSAGQTVTSQKTLQGTLEDGKRAFDTKIDIPKSYNEKEGMTFSYSCWIKIDDFAYRYGEQKVIFTKGPTDLSTMCPALFLDGTTNSLLVKLDTFGGTETIPISNIPAKKWLHFALAVDQDSVDIYINGTLYLHHTLTQLPKQNTYTVQTGIGGGFDGKIGSLQYYSYFLTPETVKTIMGSPPTPSPSDVDGPAPPYFDISWWTSRR